MTENFQKSFKNKFACKSYASHIENKVNSAKQLNNTAQAAPYQDRFQRQEWSNKILLLGYKERIFLKSPLITLLKS